MPVKTLYHGEFRKMGVVSVTVKSEPTASVKQKGKFYVELEVAGEQRYYHPENDACLEFWRGRRGQVLQVLAVGQREEAIFETEGEPTQAPPPPSQRAAPAPRPEPAKPAPTQRAKSAPEPRAAALACAKRHVAHNLVLARIATKAYASLRAGYVEVVKSEPSDVMEAAMWSSLLYGVNAAVPVGDLPLDIDQATLKEKEVAK